MSETLRESDMVTTTDIDEVLAATEAVAPVTNGSSNGHGAELALVEEPPAPTLNGHGPEADAAESSAAYVKGLELRLGELIEIEKTRDLEIHHLEAELEEQADRVRELETALFHAERRAKDLERRWQDLAEVYETAAAALVVAGGQLEEIHHQAAYRMVLKVSRSMRRYPKLYASIHRRLHRRASN